MSQKIDAFISLELHVLIDGVCVISKIYALQKKFLYNVHCIK